MPGELTTCPGLQTMELPYSILDHASPWRLEELNNPKAKFPEAYTIFESLNDRASATVDESKCQCLLGMLEVKREQLDLARKAGYNEITNGATQGQRNTWPPFQKLDVKAYGGDQRQVGLQWQSMEECSRRPLHHKWR